MKAHRGGNSMNPDPIERATDPIQSWQAEPPEEDGWYVAALSYPSRPESDNPQRHLVWLGPVDGRRAALSLSDEGVDEIEDVSWWLVPGIALPPIPKP